MKKMKILVAFISIIVISSFFSIPSAKVEDGTQLKDGISPAIDNYLVSTEDFLFYFNFYGAFIGDGHELSIEKAFDFVKIGDEILFKTIFNNCEILSLNLSADASNVIDIHCTWKSSMNGAGAYMDDFLYLLMETLLACGMESDSVSSLFTDFGKQNAFNVGDKGEMTIDGINVSYEVSSYIGISFKIKRVQNEQENTVFSSKQSENAAPLSVPPGEYVVGVDIPKGTYRLVIADDSKTAIILVTKPGDGGTVLILSDWLGKNGSTNIVEKIELKSGYFVYVYSAAIDFYEYDGLQ